MANRWWVYQRERFPVLAHGPLVAAFSFSAVSYSHLLRGAPGLPSAGSLLVAFATSMLFFLQLRIADEFKDFGEDSRYRPYRPVPRGLIKLRELAIVFAVAGAGQLLLAILLDRRLVFLLLVVWAYLALMSKEFLARQWLKERPFTYMWSHMLIMPLIDLYATSCDWLPAGTRPPSGLLWFLLVSFFNGMVIEIGRKIRSPHDEEDGVQTYSVVWGRAKAVGAWLTAMGLTTLFAVLAAERIRFLVPVVALLAILLVLAMLIGKWFVEHQQPRAGKPIEGMSGVWTLVMYLSLGAIPVLWPWIAGVAR